MQESSKRDLIWKIYSQNETRIKKGRRKAWNSGVLELLKCIVEKTSSREQIEARKIKNKRVMLLVINLKEIKASKRTVVQNTIVVKINRFL